MSDDSGETPKEREDRERLAEKTRLQLEQAAREAACSHPRISVMDMIGGGKTYSCKVCHKTNDDLGEFSR